ncbi:hypothetical protein [Piscirickettsia salmonis]|uniref:hypothetical protein n=1 Tax=Piscirickettsia salmonis TaxID=1238 RepID=UPI001B300152|nr:hypothetical protein [Piscirickettsia salmonis]
MEGFGVVFQLVCAILMTPHALGALAHLTPNKHLIITRMPPTPYIQKLFNYAVHIMHLV